MEVRIIFSFYKMQILVPQILSLFIKCSFEMLRHCVIEVSDKTLVQLVSSNQNNLKLTM